MKRTKRGIAIVASVVFLAVCLGAYSAERQDSTPARVTPPRTPTRPAQILEEEVPIPKPVTRTPSRATTPRTPSRTTPTRPSAITRPTPVRRRPAQDPHKDTVILVEAFMVEVKLSTLRSLGVPAISHGDDFVTAEHILKLLKTTDSAVVTAGAKLALGQANKARTKSTTRKALNLGTTEKKRIEYVEIGTSFTAIAEIRREKKIFAELEFEYSDIVKADKKIVVFPQTVEKNWSSSVYLEPGEPTLVGSTQDKETGTFLIVTANIKE